MNDASHLNAGQGQCRATASLLLRATPSAIDLGAGGMAVAVGLNAVHHVNRHAPHDDFLAVSLPGIEKGYSDPTPGFEIEVFGSAERLAKLIATDGIAQLMRRGALARPEVMDFEVMEGEPGTAFVRDRREERKSPGGRARQARRDARRADVIAETKGRHAPSGKPRKANFSQVVTLHYGTRPIFVRTVTGTCSGDILVSTYGFSSSEAPSVLPVQLDSGVVHNAA